jgi:hypothetical protein
MTLNVLSADLGGSRFSDVMGGGRYESAVSPRNNSSPRAQSLGSPRGHRRHADAAALERLK